MQKSYNRIAGQSLERIGALSDGVFAVAMTLIVLEIRIREHVLVHSALAPRIAGLERFEH